MVNKVVYRKYGKRNIT